MLPNLFYGQIMPRDGGIPRGHGLAVGETVILLHPPLLSVASIAM